jgi:hypothetical protein
MHTFINIVVIFILRAPNYNLALGHIWHHAIATKVNLLGRNWARNSTWR